MERNGVPVCWKDVSKFQKNYDISINVFGYDKLSYVECEVVQLKLSAYVD